MALNVNNLGVNEIINFINNENIIENADFDTISGQTRPINPTAAQVRRAMCAAAAPLRSAHSPQIPGFRGVITPHRSNSRRAFGGYQPPTAATAQK